MIHSNQIWVSQCISRNSNEPLELSYSYLLGLTPSRRYTATLTGHSTINYSFPLSLAADDILFGSLTIANKAILWRILHDSRNQVNKTSNNLQTGCSRIVVGNEFHARPQRGWRGWRGYGRRWTDLGRPTTTTGYERDRDVVGLAIRARWDEVTIDRDEERKRKGRQRSAQSHRSSPCFPRRQQLN